MAQSSCLRSGSTVPYSYVVSNAAISIKRSKIPRIPSGYSRTMPNERSIYLGKPAENDTSSWIYYRVDSVDGPDEPSGTLRAPIQICRVSWPEFDDIPPITETPGVTGLESAYEQMCSVVQSRWGVDHERSALIGILE